MLSRLPVQLCTISNGPSSLFLVGAHNGGLVHDWSHLPACLPAHLPSSERMRGLALCLPWQVLLLAMRQPVNS